MKHVAVDLGESGSARVAVGYFIPGTNVLSKVSDYPLTSKGAAQLEADRLTKASEPAPLAGPEDRKIAPGFYADQGQLF